MDIVITVLIRQVTGRLSLELGVVITGSSVHVCMYTCELIAQYGPWRISSGVKAEDVRLCR